MLSLAALLVAAAVTAGCAGWSPFAAAVPQEDIDFAQRYLALFPLRSIPAIEMGMDPAVRDPQLRLKLMQMALVFPPGPPTAVRQVLSQRGKAAGDNVSNLSFQYEYPGRWVRADVVVGRTKQAPVIRGVHIQPLPEPLERTNRLTLAGKRPVHYAAVAVALAVLLFVLYTFSLALRSPLPSKWAWAAFVLVGAVQVAFNWTTGRFSFNPMGVQLLGSGFIRSSQFSPLLITTSIPVGAIVFLIQRRDWLRSPPDEDDDPENELPPPSAGDQRGEAVAPDPRSAPSTESAPRA